MEPRGEKRARDGGGDNDDDGGIATYRLASSLSLLLLLAELLRSVAVLDFNGLCLWRGLDGAGRLLAVRVLVDPAEGWRIHADGD